MFLDFAVLLLWLLLQLLLFLLCCQIPRLWQQIKFMNKNKNTKKGSKSNRSSKVAKKKHKQRTVCEKKCINA